MLLIAIIMFLPTRPLSRQKANFFLAISRQFHLVQCLVDIIWGKNTVLYLENELKYHFNN